MDELARLADEPVGVLATVRPDGQPHLVPVVFAVVGDRVVTSVDWKPKSGRKLQRINNIESNPVVSLLVHYYSDEWSELWWTRLDGSATLHQDDETFRAGIAALVDKYPQYQQEAPSGTLISLQVERISSWSGRPHAR